MVGVKHRKSFPFLFTSLAGGLGLCVVAGGCGPMEDPSYAGPTGQSRAQPGRSPAEDEEQRRRAWDQVRLGEEQRRRADEEQKTAAEQKAQEQKAIESADRGRRARQQAESLRLEIEGLLKGGQAAVPREKLNALSMQVDDLRVLDADGAHYYQHLHTTYVLENAWRLPAGERRDHALATARGGRESADVVESHARAARADRRGEVKLPALLIVNSWSAPRPEEPERDATLRSGNPLESAVEWATSRSSARSRR
jgi:hypothetical protein